MSVRSITTRDVLKYTLLPGILPRMRGLVGSSFPSLAYFIALVYRGVRLLPATHPYLNPANIGRFGIVGVIAEAFRHIRYNRTVLKQNNIDQILVFFVILAAMLLLVLQFATLIVAIAAPQAMAQGNAFNLNFANPFSLFMTGPTLPGNILPGPPGAQQSFYDIAFIFLDRVFGVPNMFNSCIADGAANSCIAIGPGYGADNGVTVNDPANFPWPYHNALHGIFQFYSVGLLAVAILLLVYFTIVVVVETAQTGTPFGKRFNTVWAPLRLVVAAGLLVPMSFGLNAGQYIVLYAAKWGSNFATNGWLLFNSQLQNETILGMQRDLMAKPQGGDFRELMHFFSVALACETIEDTVLLPQTNQLGNSGTGGATSGGNNGPTADPLNVKAYQVRSMGQGSLQVAREITRDMTYEDAVQWANYNDVVVRFGVYDPVKYYNQRGFVYPVCGELTMKTVINPMTAATGGFTPAFYHVGASLIQQDYWDMLTMSWFEKTTSPLAVYASGAAQPPPTGYPSNIYKDISEPYYMLYFVGGLDPTGLAVPVDEPTDAVRATLYEYFWKRSDATITWAVDQGNTAQSGNPFNLPPELLARGWAAAGVWYNRIAEMNGALTTAARNLPVVSRMPYTMEQVSRAKKKTNYYVPPSEIYNPQTTNTEQPIQFERGGDESYAAQVYWEITNFWLQGGGAVGTSTRTAQTGNIVVDMINLVFGTSGLFSIRENNNVHPLAQLSSIGKTLVDRSIFLMGIGSVASLLQGIFSAEGMTKTAMDVISGFAFSILSVGAAAGVVMYYIIPFLPFIYFFFAVAGWVKAIFEAMVGVPLWALAHIRIDGGGLAGEAASTGYFLIFEIFLRPILIVFGLLASVTMFAASVQVLNDIFDLAVSNVSGFDMTDLDTTGGAAPPPGLLESLRGAVDSFFFTILYVILVYMLGQSSFKLIDLIPQSILRWMGSGASPYHDSGEGAAGQLVSYGTMGSNIAFQQVGGAMKQGMEGMGGTLRSMMDNASRRGGG